MVSLCEDLQNEFLDLLQSHSPDNEEFKQDLLHIRREVPANEAPRDKAERLKAEQRVKLVVLQHGERIGHGDLLTYQKVNTAKLMRSQSVRAIDRLEYLGIFRLQLFHWVHPDILIICKIKQN